jgi:Domain of unknown function (DUF4124)
MRPDALMTLVLIACAAHAVHAAEIYRWVDETGKTHFSDTVPAQHKKSAQLMDTRSSELSESQRKELLERRSKTREKDQAPIRPRPGQVLPDGQVLVLPKTEQTDNPKGCKALRKEYDDSLACFGRYVNANGSTKAEGYKLCKVVMDPAPQCGPLIAKPY